MVIKMVARVILCCFPGGCYCCVRSLLKLPKTEKVMLTILYFTKNDTEFLIGLNLSSYLLVSPHSSCHEMLLYFKTYFTVSLESNGTERSKVPVEDLHVERRKKLTVKSADKEEHWRLLVETACRRWCFILYIHIYNAVFGNSVMLLNRIVWSCRSEMDFKGNTFMRFAGRCCGIRCALKYCPWKP